MDWNYNTTPLWGASWNRECGPVGLEISPSMRFVQFFRILRKILTVKCRKELIRSFPKNVQPQQLSHMYRGIVLILIPLWNHSRLQCCFGSYRYSIVFRSISTISRQKTTYLFLAFHLKSSYKSVEHLIFILKGSKYYI